MLQLIEAWLKAPVAERDERGRRPMERKPRTRRGRAADRQRGATIEAVFGQMAMRGLNRFVLRGIVKVRVEWSLWRATHNLLKLWRAGWAPPALA
ncbi:MAG: transposase [Candidatus Lambdaproteobacteria bacterium]|nr:transposase [Candidatus Lambdaproteobacteria bacterium]